MVSAKILNFEHKSRDSTSTVLVHGYMLALHLLSKESLLSTLVTPRYMHRNTEYNSHVHSNYAICRVKTLAFCPSQKKNLHFLARMSCLCPDSLIMKGQKCKYFLLPLAGRPLSHRAPSSPWHPLPPTSPSTLLLDCPGSALPCRCAARRTTGSLGDGGYEEEHVLRGSMRDPR